MSDGSSPTLLVLGVGNPDRGDDGAGIAVVRRVRSKWRSPGAVFREATGEGTALIEAWAGFRRVVLVDTVRTGAAPGTIHRYDANLGPLPAGSFGGSTHAFGVAEAIETADALGRLPDRLVVHGIEGADFRVGRTLSADVEAAVERLAQSILADLASDVGSRHRGTL